MEHAELAAWLRLQMTPGVGNASARKLLTAFGLPQSIFDASTSALEQVVSASQSLALKQAPADWQTLLETTWTWLQARPDDHRIFALGDANYPSSLLNMEDPPLLLYAMGSSEVWSHGGVTDGVTHCLAVVGSRNPTPQGTTNARQFSQALAQAGLTIVSGLALGVDGAAHEGALAGAPAGQLATIAVVGTGLDRVYPRQHRDLAHRIAQRGVLLSEYPLGTPPLSANFPRRNRIIAGLSSGTLVVEATLQSGSLITARLASEQGKEVFAIPGSIHSTQARGCHALIKQGAKLVESAQDVLEEMPSGSLRTSTAGSPVPSRAADRDNGSSGSVGDPVLDALSFDPMGLDALLARTGLDTPYLQAKLMELEIHGLVSRLPGGLFQRCARA